MLALAVLALPLPAAPARATGDAAARERVRRALFEELQPVRLTNCALRRYGERHDGGYLMCGNLLGHVGAGYSYGISGYDGWGCDVARQTGATVHQYDCFDTRRPACPGGRTVFHPECVGTEPLTRDGRSFDSVANQVARNGDAERRSVLKIDVEGAEWDVFLNLPDPVLARIDQLVVEFHGTEEERFLAAVRRLKRHFHVAHLHFNNYACATTIAPFPAGAYEVLFVSRRLGAVDRRGGPVERSSLDSPNARDRPDCQALPTP